MVSGTRKNGTPGTAVTPGNYDGVHLGHRALLKEAAAFTEKVAGTETVALFFSPHPAKVVDPEAAPTPLTTPDRRRELLIRAGADRVEALHFDRAFAEVSAERFVIDTLVRDLRARYVVVGPDFRFGHRASGNVDLLQTLGHKHGFSVEVVAPVVHEGSRVSSTRIRRLLRDGDVTDAAILMARYHDVDGEVVHGDQRGRLLGFPTANLRCDPVLLPADGVYAVAVRRPGETDAGLEWGVANLGIRPTVGAGRSVEVHLFDFDRDIYGSTLRVAFVHRVRSERRFESLDALKSQIGRDTEEARRYILQTRKEWLAWL